VVDPTDLLNAWQEAIRGVGSAASSIVTGPAGMASDALSPLTKQIEQLQALLQRQLEFERELLDRTTAPARVALRLVEQATAAYRAQASAFRTAAKSFSELADLMEQQARLVEQATSAFRAPLHALKYAPGERQDIDY
jgi:methyl-accepting chemotaxis protein